MKRLPRTNASPHFTSDVLRRVRTSASRTAADDTLRDRPAFRFAAALALMLCVALLAYETAAVHQRHQRLDALRAEHQQIETELRQVKAMAGDPRPIVVLENGDTRVIVPVADRQPNRTAQSIVY
jgi:negative regulator of sigma E activity